ncbi:helix-turn-helix domain-containing protein [Paenibacillus silvae]|uniref:XRE family transcriptional regulator n=1 Tax=Paenibacillus silvae TaxID=1325358 RepID=A0A2W6NNN0_9BACL|nr:helix-turn-helix transcriptional regulator [Paenibacillus silvae]PZT57462.1 XRE family transcriptional regulator [Paenibacillus silvae]
MVSRRLKIHLGNLLDSKDMSQRELSRRTGIRHVTISKIINGEAIYISFENIEKICIELDIDVNDIMSMIKEDE